MTGEGHLTTIEVVSGRGVQRFGDEGGRDGAKEATVLACLELDASLRRLELILDGHGFVVVGDLLGLAGLAQREDLLLRADGPRGGPAAGDEQVARVAGAHLDDVAGGTEAVDFLVENHFAIRHVCSPPISGQSSSRAGVPSRGRSSRPSR